jgi:pimeloyl-ACP methyl ester carboxylesterase
VGGFGHLLHLVGSGQPAAMVAVNRNEESPGAFDERLVLPRALAWCLATAGAGPAAVMRSSALSPRRSPHVGSANIHAALSDTLYRGRQNVVEHAFMLAPRRCGLNFIHGAGHWVQYEAAEAFNAALDAALGMPLQARSEPS